MAFSACDKEMEPAPIPAGDDAIVLDVSSASLPLTRAEATGAEVAIEHIDVLIFGGTNQSKVWYERVKNLPDETGKFSLTAKRSDFGSGDEYWVYLVANSSHTVKEFEALADLNALKAMTQSDTYLHLTGIRNITSVTVPQSFLMDGVAYPASETTEPVSAAPVVLNNGVASDNTELKVVLRRAAAKIVVHIKKGDNVSFIESGLAEYYLRNLPYSTSVVAGVDAEADLRTTTEPTTSYFKWTDEEITVTAYAYAHAWSDDSAFEKDVRLVVNVPLKYKEQNYTDSYYQIPVSRDKVLERNTFYEVTVTVNAPGAVNPSTPPTLTDIKYDVQPWEETVVNVGGEDNRPIYLTVNEEEVEMHNITDDNTTLRFASSSDVNVKVTRVYYIDKFGQEKELEKVTGTDNEYGIYEGGWNQTWTNRCTITITPDEGLNGNLKIQSTLPTNNTIRYIEFEVTNADKATPRKVIVKQYPLEYITNIQGWYSYREDFGGTTWEAVDENHPLAGTGDTYNAGTTQIANRYTGCSWSSNSWSYKNGYGEGQFFGSKVAVDAANGRSTLYYYRWSESGGWWPNYTYTYTRQKSSGNLYELDNARMYHVQITASSGEYTLGVPRLDKDGYTDGGKDNAELVSPSFMIASQLGAVTTTSSKSVAADHCSQYVEVAKDGTVYKDWRLPTKAEVAIIMKFQGENADAIDIVLSGSQYWCASGVVKTSNGEIIQNEASPIRCIRDAY